MSKETRMISRINYDNGVLLGPMGATFESKRLREAFLQFPPRTPAAQTLPAPVLTQKSPPRVPVKQHKCGDKAAQSTVVILLLRVNFDDG